MAIINWGELWDGIKDNYGKIIAGAVVAGAATTGGYFWGTSTSSGRLENLTNGALASGADLDDIAALAPMNTQYISCTKHEGRMSEWEEYKTKHAKDLENLATVGSAPALDSQRIMRVQSMALVRQNLGLKAGTAGSIKTAAANTTYLVVYSELNNSFVTYALGKGAADSGKGAGTGKTK